MRRTLIALLFAPSLALGGEPTFKFDAFASMLYVNGDIENEIDDYSFSAVGFQIEKSFTDFRFVTQVHSVGLNDWKPDINWAFVEYNITDGSYLTVGRFISAIYEYSQTSYIGHSYIWTKLPISVYGLDFNSIDGINFRQEYNIDETFITFDFSYGSRDRNFVVGGVERNGNIKEYLGFAAKIETHYWTFRFDYTQAYATYDSILNVAVRSVPFAENSEPKNIEDIAFSDDRFHSVSTYIKYSNDWLIEAEFQGFTINDAYIKSDIGVYLSVGYQFDNIIPYILFTGSETSLGYTKSEFNLIDPRPELQLLYSNFYDIAEVGYTSVSIGARYDYSQNSSISVQAGKVNYNKNLEKEDSTLSFSVNLIF